MFFNPIGFPIGLKKWLFRYFIMDTDSIKMSDFEIVRRVTDGDVNAFELLLIKYKNHVFQLVTRHVPYRQAEEIAHDVFVRAYQSLPKFKFKSSFKKWLTGIAVKTCYDFWRREYRTRELPMSSLSEEQQELARQLLAVQSESLSDQKDAQKEAQELLDWALNKLSAKDRMVLELVYLEGRSVKEAAELLGWTAANVKVRSFRSRKKLRRLLADLREEYKGGR